MKKNNTSIDIVAFGDLTDETLEKLQAFNEAVKGGEGSHLEVVPPGPNLLSDSILASPILAGEGGAATANGGGAGGAEGGDDFEFGIDYKACGFCKCAARHGDKAILPAICGLDFDAYATRGIKLVRTQTLASGASHCDFRFSRSAPNLDGGHE